MQGPGKIAENTLRTNGEYFDLRRERYVRDRLKQTDTKSIKYRIAIHIPNDKYWGKQTVTPHSMYIATEKLREAIGKYFDMAPVDVNQIQPTVFVVRKACSEVVSTYTRNEGMLMDLDEYLKNQLESTEVMKSLTLSYDLNVSCDVESGLGQNMSKTGRSSGTS